MLHFNHFFLCCLQLDSKTIKGHFALYCLLAEATWRTNEKIRKKTFVLQNQQRRKDILSEVSSMVRKLADYIEADEAADTLSTSFLHSALPPVLNEGIVFYTKSYSSAAFYSARGGCWFSFSYRYDLGRILISVVSPTVAFRFHDHRELVLGSIANAAGCK